MDREEEGGEGERENEEKRSKQKNRRGNAAERIEGSRSSAEAAEKLIVYYYGVRSSLCTAYCVDPFPFFCLFFSDITEE